tara:strand:- start:334 stop:1050 length:717 start_codon:yes stop_codon:yes gene_type:complete
MFYPLVNRNKKFIVFWNAKAGCTAVKRWYINTIGLDYENLNPHKFLASYPRHGGVGEFYATRDQVDDEYSDYFKFIVCRNPWSRLVSYYKNKKIQVGWKNKTWPIDIRVRDTNSEDFSFKDLVYFIDKTPDLYLEQHIRSQTSDLEGIRFDAVVKLENFESQMNLICDYLKIEQRNFENTNKNTVTKSGRPCFDMRPGEFSDSFMPSYHYFYDDELKTMIANKFKTDIKYFKYTFEEG